MHADPWKYFIDLIKVIVSKIVAALKKDYYNSWCGHNRTVDIERSDHRNDKEIQDNLKEQF